MQLLNRIDFQNLRGDLFGGMTTAIIALPMALTFGVASGAGPAAGLYGAVLVGLFAALFGGTPTLISEPTGPMTVVMTAVIAQLTATHPENGMAMAFTVVMMAGIFQICFGLLKLGKYVTLMPYTVISGFMSGIGIILIVLQFGPLLGQANPGGGIIGTFENLPNLLVNVSPAETALGVLSVAIIFLMPKPWKRWIPSQLAALAIGTAVSLVLFGDVDIRRIGEIPTGLPALQIPTFSAAQWQMMCLDALVLGMLGCIDALLTSTIADSLTRTQHNSNKELIGQGIGNLVSGLFGGIAGAGATMGTVVNIQSGGKTPLSGIIRATILLLVVLWAAPLTANIPLAVLAGIALQVGIKIIDWNFLKRAHHISLKAAAIMYGVIILTVFVDLIAAVGIGLFVANILTIDRLSQIRSREVKAITDADDEITMNEEEKNILSSANGRIVLFHLSGPMIFGVAKAISRQQTIGHNYDVLIVDLSDVPMIGVTSSLALENIIQDACQKERKVFIVGATGQIQRRLQRLGIFELISHSNLFATRQEALRQARELLDKRIILANVNYSSNGLSPESNQVVKN